MNTFLLLSGRSTRFWPLKEKAFFPLCGKTLLEHQVERLRKAGCENIVLVAGTHNHEEAKAICPELDVIVQEGEGMQGAVASALKHYPSDPLMVVGSNDVIDPSAYQALVDTSGDGAILAYKVDQYFPGGYLSVAEGRVTGVIEKPGEGNEPSDLINIVAHVHRDPAALSAALQSVDNTTDDGYEQALAKLFSEKNYHAVSYNGPWQPVKYPWHILKVLEMLLDEIPGQAVHSTAQIHPSAEIVGNVIIDEGVKVMSNAVIRGPAYIGKRSIVANNALVRGSSVGDDCVVGFTTEIKASALASHVWTHMNYIGDSIVGSNVSFGGGTVTGNLRLDEGEIFSVVKGEKIATGMTKFGTVIGDNARIGINVSTNPGCKIGSGSFVSSAVLVGEDIADTQFVFMKEGRLHIKENTADVLHPDDREKYRKGV